MIESNDCNASTPSRRVAQCGIALIVLASPAFAEESGTLTVRVMGLRSSTGRVGCTIFDGPRGFPVDPTAALKQRWCPIEGSTSSCRFEALTRGTYAAACFHDENGNGALDRGVFGIPKEGTVASNHARGTLGTPRFADAKFAFSGTPADLALRMGY